MNLGPEQAESLTVHKTTQSSICLTFWILYETLDSREMTQQ